MKEEKKERKRYILENVSVKKRRRPGLLEICRGRSRPVSIYTACIFADTYTIQIEQAVVKYVHLRQRIFREQFAFFPPLGKFNPRFIVDR